MSSPQVAWDNPAHSVSWDSGSTTKPDLDAQLHKAYDDRPLWRKALGMEPTDLSPELQKHLANQKVAAQKQIADQLHGVASGYKEGAIYAAKTAPFMALGPAGGAVADAVGGGTIGLLANAGVQGVGAAAISKAEGASNSGAATSGALQAAGPLVSKASELAAPYLAKTAVGQYVRALAPTTAKNKAIANKIAPEMIDRGISGNLGTIADNANDAASAVKPSLNAAYDSLEAQKPVIPDAGKAILDSLDKLRSKYVVGGKVANPQAVNAINGVQEIIDQYGNDISPKTLRGLKQSFDETVSQAGGFAGADLTTKFSLKAQKAAGNTIRDILHSESPDIAALDKEISFQLAVNKLAAATDLRQSGQSGGLNKVFTPLATGMAGAGGFALGGPHGGIEAAIGTAGAATVAQVLRSPAWRTMSAVKKDAIASAMASGRVGMALDLMTKFGASTAAQTADQPQPQASQP